ncbi:fumarylacetoacetate hydrolase family protein [Pseudoalteromonas sp. MMG010]|uniref:fumarylacetoacetate hydrolase family protein n=1 Tax=Pseudoalteromonas sp. MMG010 TaxID=2822685 RepID=UPI001B39FE4C|nr:fumarylacetoacetate hydrolase family protein [Pseudoalteromonas sp. MMG010]MBQ4833874.1 fumarylacetoacetate hydrolase family protein [Pseudoalteromonas sp. MMG010]
MQTIKFAAQAVTPEKVVCVGRNYTAHIAELNNETPTEMVLFNKPNSAISDTLYAVHNDDTLHYETELCFVVKNNQLAGIGLGLDLTKRAVQSRLKHRGLPWERAKAFNASVVFTPFIAITHNMNTITFELRINDVITQRGDSQFMLHQPQQILAEINTFMQLHDHDVIMTGTPAGVGEVVKGNTYSVSLFADNNCILTHHWQAV